MQFPQFKPDFCTSKFGRGNKMAYFMTQCAKREVSRVTHESLDDRIPKNDSHIPFCRK